MNGQVGHPRPAASSPGSSVVVPAIAVLLAAVLLVGLALATLGSDTASARTELAEGAGATATLADGTTGPLEVGDEVPPGATVRAPAGAVLRTRDRDVLLSPDGELTVLDGARQVLEAGYLMVDARRGPGVTVETRAADVTTPEGAVSRVEPGPLLRVGAFAGDPVQVRPAGRRATAQVEALHQVQVAVAGLPSRSTPLALTGDLLERRLAADLVAADRALTDLGRTLDSGGEQGPAVLAALRTALPAVASVDPLVTPAATGQPAPPAAPRSEAALAFLLAAAPVDGGAVDLAADDVRLADRYTRTRDLRAAGGSWGVVARLVDSSVPAVSGLLDRLLAPLVVVAGGAPAPSDVLGLLLPPPAAPPAAGPGTAGPAPAPGPAPTAPDDGPDGPSDPPPPTGPPPGPVPPPPEDPVGTVVDTVEVVVDTVVGLLPDPPAPVPPVPPVPPLPDEEPTLVGRLLDPLPLG